MIQQGLDTLHAYLHASSMTRLADLEQLQAAVQQLELAVQQSMQEMQQQREDEQQQLAGLSADLEGVGDLSAVEPPQQQPHAVDAGAGSRQDSGEVSVVGSLAHLLSALAAGLLCTADRSNTISCMAAAE